MDGFLTLLYKEILRFWKVSFQTVAAPILTALLFLLIFTHVLEGRVRVYISRCISFTQGIRKGCWIRASGRPSVAPSALSSR